MATDTLIGPDENEIRQRKQSPVDKTPLLRSQSETSQESVDQVKSVKESQITSTLLAPVRFLVFLFHLFFSPRFFVHRVTGLMYLIEWATAFVLFFYDYDMFRRSPLPWLVPTTGLLQTVTAIYTFTFLPRKKDQGYFSDKYTMSYSFIVENSFFAMILLFQWLYMDDNFFSFFKNTVVVELAFVFLPYAFRDLWPKTSFRDSLYSKGAKSDKNEFFYTVAITVTRYFYIWAKHYIGYFLNYARYMDRLNDEHIKHIYLLELFGAFATTIAVFLHTLKFKKYMGPRTSFLIYFASYMSTFYTYVRCFDIFYRNMDLTLITFGGVLINFKSRRWQLAYQLVVMGLLATARYNKLPDVLSDYLPLPIGH